MRTKRVRNTIQYNLTPEQEEEKKAANLNFFNGDITQVIFSDQKEIEQFIYEICRKKASHPVLRTEKQRISSNIIASFLDGLIQNQNFLKRLGVHFILIFQEQKMASMFHQWMPDITILRSTPI